MQESSQRGAQQCQPAVRDKRRTSLENSPSCCPALFHPPLSFPLLITTPTLAMDSFEISPHLARYNVPIAEFFASMQEYTQFIVGAYIFSSGRHPSYYGIEPSTVPATAITVSEGADGFPPRVLLLRRSLSSNYGGYWEGPGGSCEQTDATMLSALVREVFEESGLQVSKILDLVAIEDWECGKTVEGKTKRAVKIFFLADVYKGNQQLHQQHHGELGWEHKVKIAPREHEQFQWATEEEVREGTEKEEGRFRFCGEEGYNFLKAFKVFRSFV